MFTIGRVLNIALSPLGFELRRKDGVISNPHPSPKFNHVPETYISKCRVLPSRADLISLLPKRGTVAEIGVAQGNFASEILRLAQPTTLHLIDAAPGQFGTKFDSEISVGQVVVHQGLATQILSTLPEALFDWVYLDTSQTYRDTRRELGECARVVKDFGYVAGHDFCLGDPYEGTPFGVIEAVYDFCVEEAWALRYLTLDVGGYFSFCLSRLNT